MRMARWSAACAVGLPRLPAPSIRILPAVSHGWTVRPTDRPTSFRLPPSLPLTPSFFPSISRRAACCLWLLSKVVFDLLRHRHRLASARRGTGGWLLVTGKQAGGGAGGRPGWLGPTLPAQT